MDTFRYRLWNLRNAQYRKVKNVFDETGINPVQFYCLKYSNSEIVQLVLSVQDPITKSFQKLLEKYNLLVGVFLLSSGGQNSFRKIILAIILLRWILCISLYEILKIILFGVWRDSAFYLRRYGFVIIKRRRKQIQWQDKHDSNSELVVG